jgi:hypothetical protein
MSKQSSAAFTGKFKITIHRNGKLINEQQGKNLVVDTGLEWLLTRLSDVVVTDIMTVMAIGSGLAAVLPTDTELEIETAATRNTASIVTPLLNQLTLTFDSWI